MMLIFLIKFSILLIISGIFIVSFYNISRYWIVVENDGTEKKTGDVLFWWSMFWERRIGVKDKWWQKEGLEYKLSELNKMFPHIASKFTVSELYRTFLVLKEGQTFTEAEQQKVESVLMVNIITKHENEFYLFSNEPKYLFPRWIIKPMSSCPKCMANPFGTAIYFTIDYLDKDFMSWTPYYWQSLIFFWFLFIISLCAINNYLYSKIPK